MTKRHHRYLALSLLVSGASLAACRGQDLDLGDTDRGGADAGQSADSPTPDAGAPAATESDSSEGDDERWSGYIENYSFPSGSDSLVLTFTRLADGGVTGHAVFGDAPLYPPPTDPNAGYPDTNLDGGYDPQDLEGFRYTLEDGQLAGTRLRANVDPGELFAQWCEIQTPQPFGVVGDGGTPLGYTCAPPMFDTFDSGLPDGCYVLGDGGIPTPVACLRFALCQEVDTCNCTAAGCTYAPWTADAVTLDIQIDGTQASGSVQLVSGNPHNTYLTSP